jgi:hypothetical protein
VRNYDGNGFPRHQQPAPRCSRVDEDGYPIGPLLDDGPLLTASQILLAFLGLVIIPFIKYWYLSWPWMLFMAFIFWMVFLAK